MDFMSLKQELSKFRARYKQEQLDCCEVAGETGGLRVRLLCVCWLYLLPC